MRSLPKLLVRLWGLDLTGWTLTEARDVSADGLTIVGIGTNPDGNTEAWIAHLPELPTGSAGTCDVNRDGFEDGRDISALIAAVLAAADDPDTLCAADMDSSGVIDPADLPPFVECLLGDE